MHHLNMFPVNLLNNLNTQGTARAAAKTPQNNSPAEGPDSIWHINLGKARAAGLQLEQDIVKERPDLVGVNEPYILPDGTLPFIPNNYTNVNMVNSQNKSRCTIVIKKNIVHEIVTVERDLVAISLGDLLCISCYAAPTDELNDTLHKISNILNRHQGLRTVIIGDFNAKSEIWGNRAQDERGETLLEFCAAEGLNICNESDTCPTFQSSRGVSWIDLAITRNLDLELIINDDFVASEHNRLRLNLKDKIEKTRSRNIPTQRINWQRFEEESEDIIEDLTGKLTQIEHKQSLNDWIKEAQEEIWKVLKSTLKSSKIKHQSHWWSPELRTARSAVRALRRRFQNENDEDTRNQYKMIYRRELAKYKKLITKEKRRSFKEYVDRITTSTIFGRNYKVITNKKNTMQRISGIQKTDGTLAETHQEATKMIANYHFPFKPSGQNWTFDNHTMQINYDEIKYAMDAASRGKTPGIDGIPAEVFKHIMGWKPEILTRTINACLKLNTFPKEWKKAKVVLIPKDGKPKELPSSYRPICLLPTWGKLLDKIITNRLVFHLESNNLISNRQYGFRQYKGTSEALTALTDKIEATKAQNHLSTLISIDLRNAFNSVDPHILASKIDKLNLEVGLRNLILDFLRDRTVDIEGDEYKYNVGVPQGSSLGPILWLIVINDLLETDFGDQVTLQAFADDVLVHINSSKAYLITDQATPVLAKIQEWVTLNKLEVNTSKTSYTIIGKITRRPTVKMGNENIQFTSTLKYLGLTIDPLLTWRAHLDEIGHKVSKVQYLIGNKARVEWGLRPSVRKAIYHFATEKVISYAGEIWFKETIRMRQKLLKIQRTALKCITSAYTTAPTSALLVLAGIMPIDLLLGIQRKMYAIKKGKEGLDEGGLNIPCENIETRYEIYKEPWERKILPWKVFDPEEEEDNYDLSIYTDGSKLEDKVGYAIVTLRQGEITHKIERRLPDYASVGTAELLAINEAVEMQELKKYNKIRIISDSMSSIKLICGNTITRVKENIRKMVDQMQDEGTQIDFYWTKAHIGIQGNEWADQAAKAATRHPTIGKAAKISLESIKHILKKTALENWQTRWDSDETGRRTYDFYPRVNQKRILGNHYVNQVLTGHGCEGPYQRRFHGRAANCGLCRVENTYIHILQECPKYENNWSQLPEWRFKPLKQQLGNYRALQCIIKTIKEEQERLIEETENSQI